MYCCFTGHRPEQLPWGANEEDPRCTLLKASLDSVINQAITDGYTDFYCGMARGIDTYAAETVLEKMKTDKNILLHAVLPCPDQHEAWPEKDRIRYERILDLSSSRTLISPVYTDTCMLTRNRFMVDNSTRLIAVWNGYFKGGTAYTVRYAKKQGKEIHLIRPGDASITVF